MKSTVQLLFPNALPPTARRAVIKQLRDEFQGGGFAMLNRADRLILTGNDAAKLEAVRARGKAILGGAPMPKPAPVEKEPAPREGRL